VVLRPALRLAALITDEEGRPLAGVQAVVYPSDRQDETPEERLEGRDAPFLGEGDGAGRLRVDKIPSGLFDLYLTAPGFAPYFQERVESPEAVEPVLDLGTIPLKPGLTLRGVVVDPAGLPVAGAAIRSLSLSRRQGVRWMSHLADSQALLRSGPDGSFEIRDLGSDSSAILTVERERYETRQITFEPHSGGGVERVVLWPTYALRGAVRDEAGRPVAGAVVGVSDVPGTAGIPRPEPGGRSGGLFKVPRVTTDEGGRFELVLAETGPLRLRAEGAELQAATLDLDLPEARDREGLALVLHPGAVLEGRVTGPEGAARSGARIELDRLDPHAYRMSRPVARTGADGGFRLAGLETGTWRLNAGGDGIVTVEREVEIRPGENRVEVELEASLAIAGRVLDPEGRPAGEAQVLAEGEHSTASTGTRDDGRFQFEDLPPGPYGVRARDDRFASSEPVRLDLRAGAQGPLEFRLRPGGSLSGRVSGPPAERLGEVSVEAWLRGEERTETKSARLNAQGEYRLDGMEAGEWNVGAKLDLRFTETKVTLAGAGSATRLDLELPMGEALEGKLTLDGEPLADVVVYTMAADRRPTGVAQTGPTGEFRIEGLAPGTHLLLIGYEDRGGSKGLPAREVTVPAAGPLTIELRQTP